MLVVTRRLNETVKSDGPAEFKILEIRGGNVKVGIVADKRVSIVRGEIKGKYDKTVVSRTGV